VVIFHKHEKLSYDAGGT